MKNKKAAPWIARQGDVLIERIDEAPDAKWAEIPKTADGSTILAQGEATNHHHRIRNENVCFLRADDMFERVLIVSDVSALLTHEEHAPVTLPPGKYAVSIQQTYTPEELRNVED